MENACNHCQNPLPSNLHPVLTTCHCQISNDCIVWRLLTAPGSSLVTDRTIQLRPLPSASLTLEVGPVATSTSSAMSSSEPSSAMSERFAPQRPIFHVGQHVSGRDEPLTDLEYGHLLNFGVSCASELTPHHALTHLSRRSASQRPQSPTVTSEIAFLSWQESTWKHLRRARRQPLVLQLWLELSPSSRL